MSEHCEKPTLECVEKIEQILSKNIELQLDSLRNKIALDISEAIASVNKSNINWVFELTRFTATLVGVLITTWGLIKLQ